MWNILWEVPLEKFLFEVLQFSQIRPICQFSILFFLALGTPLQDEKADKCLGTFKLRNSLSNNVKAFDTKILCHCLLHKSTFLPRTEFQTLHFPVRMIQIAVKPSWGIYVHAGVNSTVLFVVTNARLRIKWVKLIFKFKVFKSVHHHTSQLNQPTRCNDFSSLLFDIYLQLNMFRASSRPSSGAQQLQ
jgi:hypothetical protein